jgi:hypothetical protein
MATASDPAATSPAAACVWRGQQTEEWIKIRRIPDSVEISPFRQKAAERGGGGDRSKITLDGCFFGSATNNNKQENKRDRLSTNEWMQFVTAAKTTTFVTG